MNTVDATTPERRRIDEMPRSGLPRAAVVM